MISLLIHGFLSVNARLLIAFGTAFYAITIITAVFDHNQFVNTQVRAFCVIALFAVDAFDYFVRHLTNFFAEPTFRQKPQIWSETVFSIYLNIENTVADGW